MFNPKTPVSDLYADFVTAKPQYIDLSTGEYAFWQSVTCDNCGKIFVTETGLGACPVCGQEPEVDGPIYNYVYPVSLERVGGAEATALAVKGLSLCILEHDDQHYLALTGCGMDMSWDIAEGYMRLGYLPPSHFADLPLFAGMQLNRTTRWVLAGMRRSLRLQIGWLKSSLSSIHIIRQSLVKRPQHSSETKQGGTHEQGSISPGTNRSHPRSASFGGRPAAVPRPPRSRRLGRPG